MQKISQIHKKNITNTYRKVDIKRRFLIFFSQLEFIFQTSLLQKLTEMYSATRFYVLVLTADASTDEPQLVSNRNSFFIRIKLRFATNLLVVRNKTYTFTHYYICLLVLEFDLNVVYKHFTSNLPSKLANSILRDDLKEISVEFLEK